MNGDDLIVTLFELDEKVFVPAGDGKPAQAKRKGDLLPDEMQRYFGHQLAQGEAWRAECDLEMAWINEADRRRECVGSTRLRQCARC